MIGTSGGSIWVAIVCGIMQTWLLPPGIVTLTFLHTKWVWMNLKRKNLLFELLNAPQTGTAAFSLVESDPRSSEAPLAGPRRGQKAFIFLFVRGHTALLSYIGLWLCCHLSWQLWCVVFLSLELQARGWTETLHRWFFDGREIDLTLLAPYLTRKKDNLLHFFCLSKPSCKTVEQRESRYILAHTAWQNLTWPTDRGVCLGQAELGWGSSQAHDTSVSENSSQRMLSSHSARSPCTQDWQSGSALKIMPYNVCPQCDDNLTNLRHENNVFTCLCFTFTND